MSRKIKVTKNYIDSLKSEIQSLKEEKIEHEKDLRKYRIFFRQLLQENISMISKNQYYSSEKMVNKLSKLMNDVRSWHWGFE